ncbi:urease accessory protein [Chitinophaga jiangningensis]|uniref:Urease accessory protein UreD n=1 Tax=Chitinophaga jiangningensis TaxID=1419482 RepID=A0A1M7K2H7_9BACT|nr:urease accessory protein UreD [Chitinophaga jiangningensis]SHM59381.1 urease accessory protein [Chitinophaga jiangningensis]
MNNRLTIKGGFKHGRSYLKDTFFTPPFRVVDVSEHRHDPTAYVMVMSSSPGMLDGDHYDINIEVETGCSLQLQSQSYQRIFNMERGASQLQQIKLHPGAAFTYVQHPVVPHEKAIFKGRNRIELADDCLLTFGEILTCGRKHSGEVFRYTSFHNITEVYHHAKLLVKDNLLLQPLTVDMAAIGQMEGFTHQATLMHVDTGEGIGADLVPALYTLLEEEKEVALGISSPSKQVLVLRMLGNGGEQLFNALQKVAHHCRHYKTQETHS